MKKLLFFFAFFPLHAFCQTAIPRNAEGKYEYTDVVKVDSASADKLYSNAKLFIVDAFKSGKDVTQLNDDNTKTVAGSGNFSIETKGLMSSAIDKRIHFRILIQCKEEKYKYTLNNLEASFIYGAVDDRFPLEYGGDKSHQYLTKKQRLEYNKAIVDNMISLISDLKKHMAANPQDF